MDFWTFYWGFVAFVFGAIVGSFLNVAIWRMPRGESVSHPPSHCPACNHRLRIWPDMVPLASQAWYRSRCRYCGERFSWRYFWVEMLTAVVFTALYARYYLHGAEELSETGRVLSAMLAMLFASALIVIFFIDLEHYEIPDMAVLVALAAAVGRDVVLIQGGIRPLWQQVPGTDLSLPIPMSLLGAVVAFWLLWQFAALMTALLNKEAMGAGDSTLMAAMGAFLIPWPLLLLAFLFAVALGTVGGLLGAWLAARDEARAAGNDGSPVQPNAETPLPPPEPPLSEESPAFPDNEVAQAGNPVSGAHRGAVGAPSQGGEEDEPGIPSLPPRARWGRVITVLGTWAGVGGLWLGASQYAASPALGIGLGAVGLALAAGLLVYGVRMWKQGDAEWLPAMDELFEEGDPGPRFIPFGPYLVTGTLLALLFGEGLVMWYVESQLPVWIADAQRMPWD